MKMFYIEGKHPDGIPRYMFFGHSGYKFRFAKNKELAVKFADYNKARSAFDNVVALPFQDQSPRRAELKSLHIINETDGLSEKHYIFGNPYPYPEIQAKIDFENPFDKLADVILETSAQTKIEKQNAPDIIDKLFQALHTGLIYTFRPTYGERYKDA
jgi:hypothetical protein